MKRMIKNISVLGLAMAFAVTSLSNSVAYAASYPDVELSGAESETTNTVDTSVYKSSVDATFSITADMLGGDLVVEIPDAIDLVNYKVNKDTADTLFADGPVEVTKPSGDDDFYAVADVGVLGNLIPNKKLCISLTREANYNNYGVWFNHESAVDSAKVFAYVDLMDTVSDDTSANTNLGFKLDAEDVVNCNDTSVDYEAVINTSGTVLAENIAKSSEFVPADTHAFADWHEGTDVTNKYFVVNYTGTLSGVIAFSDEGYRGTAAVYNNGSQAVFSYKDIVTSISALNTDEARLEVSFSDTVSSIKLVEYIPSATPAGTFSFVVTNDVYVGDYSTTLNFNISTEDI